MRITHTQLLEWVKDGNKEMLSDYFISLDPATKKLHHFFAMLDNHKRNVIHWASYLGQVELLEWWCELYPTMINLNQNDEQGYNPVDLASIKGYIFILERYSDKYDRDSQFQTVQLLVNNRAQIQIHKKKKNPLHWAYYYGNKDLIEFLITKNFYLQFELDADDNYPIDYLFYENRPRKYRKQNDVLFQLTVVKYVGVTNKDFQFTNTAMSKRKKTHKFKEDLGTANLNTLRQLEKTVTIQKIELHSDPELEPLKNMPNSTYKHQQAQSGHSQSFTKGTRNIQSSPQERQPRLRIESTKIPSKLLTVQDLPLYDGEPMKEPEEEKFPEVKVSNSRLISEAQEQQPSEQIRSVSNPLLKQSKSRLRRMDQKSSWIQSARFTILPDISNASRTVLFEHRLLYWSARLGYVEFFTYFLNKKCNPFAIAYQGFNSLHIASFKGKYKILKIILESEYYFDQSNLASNQETDFEMKKAINILTQNFPSNALHLAIEQENYHCMKILISHGISYETVNHRCLKPFELTYNTRILDFYYENIQKIDTHCFTELGYQYVIQTKGTTNVESDIVYIQLQNIVETFKERGWKFEFLILNGPNLDKLDDFIANTHKLKALYHFYIIRLSPDTIYRLADLKEIECYNFKTKYICKFKYEKHCFFEFPKDLWVQMLILQTLNDEFDVDKFVLEKLIIDHYPLEDRKKGAKITQFWEEQQYNCIRDSTRFYTDQLALRPLHAIASYYGPAIAWYIALNVQIIGWLMVPAFFGAILGLYLILANDINSFLVPFYALLMTLWSTLFMEKWKNRESELRFSWDMHRYKETQPRRVMYTGHFHIDETNNKVEVYDRFTTFHRRLITELPMILIGMGIIAGSFYGFLIWQNQQPKSAVIMPIVINSINGASMTLLCELYKWLCRKLVTWENHMYDSSQEYSYVLKVFLFEFIISYISVVYIAVTKDDSNQLAISVASIIITRGLISNMLSNVLPWLTYRYMHSRYRKRWDQFKQTYRFRYLKEKNHSTFPKLSNRTFITDTLTQDQQMEFLEQLEENQVKRPQKILYDEYTNIAIQFGYTTMFAPAFPAAPLFFMINCYINLKFTIHNYQKILKREKAQAADSIGIWLQIFEIMNYSATFMNCIVIGTINKQQIYNLIGQSDNLTIVIILVAAEHILLLIKYLLDIFIPDSPKWVERELKRYKYLEQKHEEKEGKEVRLSSTQHVNL